MTREVLCSAFQTFKIENLGWNLNRNDISHKKAKETSFHLIDGEFVWCKLANRPVKSKS